MLEKRGFIMKSAAVFATTQPVLSYSFHVIHSWEAMLAHDNSGLLVHGQALVQVYHCAGRRLLFASVVSYPPTNGEGLKAINENFNCRISLASPHLFLLKFVYCRESLILLKYHQKIGILCLYHGKESQMWTADVGPTDL